MEECVHFWNMNHCAHGPQSEWGACLGHVSTPGKAKASQLASQHSILAESQAREPDGRSPSPALGECLCPPESMSEPSPPCDGVRAWGLGEGLSLGEVMRVGPHSGICALLTGGRHQSLLSLCHVRAPRKAAVCRPTEAPQPRNRIGQHSGSDFQPPELWEINALFRPPVSGVLVRPPKLTHIPHVHYT